MYYLISLRWYLKLTKISCMQKYILFMFYFIKNWIIKWCNIWWWWYPKKCWNLSAGWNLCAVGLKIRKSVWGKKGDYHYNGLWFWSSGPVDKETDSCICWYTTKQEAIHLCERCSPPLCLNVVNRVLVFIH